MSARMISDAPLKKLECVIVVNAYRAQNRTATVPSTSLTLSHLASNQYYEARIITSPTLQMRRARHRAVK